MSVPVALFRTLVRWPDLMDRVRFRAVALYPVALASTIQDVRVAFCTLAEGQDSGVVSIPRAVWGVLVRWPAFLRRAMVAGVAFSLDEQAAINAGGTMVDALNALDTRDAPQKVPA